MPFSGTLFIACCSTLFSSYIKFSLQLVLSLPGSCSIWFSELFDITLLDPTQHNSVVWLGIPAGFFMEKSLSSLVLFHVALPFFFFSSSIGDFITLASCFLPSKFLVSQTLLLVYHSSFFQVA